MSMRKQKAAWTILFVFLSLGCKAQSLQRAYSLGNFVLSPHVTTEVRTNVIKYTYASGLITTSGPMEILNSQMYANATVATANFTWITVFGVKVQHVVMQSQEFWYNDPLTGTSYWAYLAITLTQTGPWGQGSFRVTNAATGAVAAESTLNGIYAEVPFTSGGITI